MRVVIEIELGNDAMQTYEDLREALESVCRNFRYRPQLPRLGDWGSVRDKNGNTVGQWKVK